jgi:hypothetical protein
MYFLDTDTLTLIERKQAQVVERLSRVDPDEVTTTLITKIEMLQGRRVPCPRLGVGMVQLKLCGGPRLFSRVPCPRLGVDTLQRKGRRLSCPRQAVGMAPGGQGAGQGEPKGIP